jgi:hypothetical protein
MRHLLTILAALFLCAAPVQAQTMKALMFATNGQVVANTGANTLTFTNDGVKFQSNGIVVGNAAARFSQSGGGGGAAIGWQGSGQRITFASGIGMRLEEAGLGIAFGTNNTNGAAITRTNLGLGGWATLSDGDTLRSENLTIGEDGAADAIQFTGNGGVFFFGNRASQFRTALGLGPSNNVTFAGITNNGDITINSTTSSNGLLFIRRTNSEAFLGLANLLASNNTTISNETLFRVGVAETNNKSAQFGFRSTNTNGNGVAVFSVYGFDALMQIGADASTNAVLYSGGGTNNEVMTLIRDGATEFARPLRFSTNASTRPATNAPAVTTNVVAWVEMRIGTNSYRVPLYQ